MLMLNHPDVLFSDQTNGQIHEYFFVSCERVITSQSVVLFVQLS